MRKKILFIITYLELGGAQKQLLSVLKGLDRKKYDLYLCAGDAGYLKKQFLKLPDVNTRLIPTLTRSINPILDLASFIRFYFHIKKNKFDIVHTHSPKASFLGRWAAYFAGVKNIVYTVHGWPFHRFMNALAYKFYLFLERATAKITKKIIVVSDEGYKTAIEERIASPEKIIRIHYGIDTKDFEAAYARRNGRPGKGPIVTVSSFKPQKYPFNFLKIARALVDKRPELNFTILGDGPLRKKVEKRLKRLGLGNKVELKGWVDDVAAEFKNASMFVLPSLWEGLPITLIEAAASGVPFVVTRTDGVRDVVGDLRCGIVTEPAMPAQIEKACRNILDNYAEWTERIRRDRETLDIDYWSVERMLRELEVTYTRLIGGDVHPAYNLFYRSML